MEQGSKRKKVALGVFGEVSDRTGWCWQPDWTPQQHWLHGLGGVPRQPEHWTCVSDNLRPVHELCSDSEDTLWVCKSGRKLVM